jgi:dihydroflavonol-4-reductase
VDDVVEGIIAAGERGQSARRYVLGGANLLFAEIYATVTSVVRRHPILLPVPRWARRPMTAAAWLLGRLTRSRFITPQIVRELFAFKYYSSARAGAELGWHGHYTFRQSAERAWAFYKENGLI